MLQMSPALDLVGDDSGLRFTLDGFTVLEDSPLSLFRDGDTVTIHSKTQHALPALEKRKKRKRLNLTSGMLGQQPATHAHLLLCTNHSATVSCVS